MSTGTTTRQREQQQRQRQRHARPRRRLLAGDRARRRLVALVAALPIGLLGSGTLVWQATSAAFVGTTANPGNTWQTGTVSLSNDRNGTAVFSLASEGYLVPGSTGSKCITVTYTGTVDTATTGVRLYGTVTNTSQELADALKVTVQLSTTALGTTPDANCSPAFQASPVSYPSVAASAFPTGYATGLGDLNNDGTGDWRPTASTDKTRTYKISYTLPAGSYSTSVQGKNVTIAFTWEAQSFTPGP